MTLSIEYRATEELLPYAMNSRTHSDDQVDQIVASIKEFGFTNPILIDETDCIIAGHGRLMAAKRLELKEVPTIMLDDLDESQRKAYVIADNKLALNAGWNEKMLMRELFSLDDEKFDLKLTGFDKGELNKLLDLGEDGSVINGETEFSEELGEAHNFVVLYFDNEIDWLSAQTHFDLPSVHSKRSNGKPWSKGIGRVINGAKYLNTIKGDLS